MCDVDVAFSAKFLERCRWNTKPGKKVSHNAIHRKINIYFYRLQIYTFLRLSFCCALLWFDRFFFIPGMTHTRFIIQLCSVCTIRMLFTHYKERMCHRKPISCWFHVTLVFGEILDMEWHANIGKCFQCLHLVNVWPFECACIFICEFIRTEISCSTFEWTKWRSNIWAGEIQFQNFN